MAPWFIVRCSGISLVFFCLQYCDFFFTVHQHESAIGIHVSPPSWTHLPPHPIPPGLHRAVALGALCHSSNSHWLSMLHRVIYVSMLFLPIIPSYFFFFFNSFSLKVKVASDSLQPHGLYSPRNSPGQNTGMGSLSFLKGIFPMQGSNPGLLHLQADSWPAEPPGKPKSTRMGSLSLPLWTFLIQESNQGLLHSWWILYQLSYQGSPVFALCYFFYTHVMQI